MEGDHAITIMSFIIFCSFYFSAITCLLSISIYRYKWWLGKLADISLRQSAAYGVWNFNFNILYHSTQV